MTLGMPSNWRGVCLWHQAWAMSNAHSRRCSPPYRMSYLTTRAGRRVVSRRGWRRALASSATCRCVISNPFHLARVGALRARAGLADNTPCIVGNQPTAPRLPGSERRARMLPIFEAAITTAVMQARCPAHACRLALLHHSLLQ